MAAIIRLSAVARGQVLEPAHGRLRAQVRPALGRPADRHLERRVGAQRVAVVGVRVAGRDQQHPEADHLGQGVVHPLRRPRVLEAARQALGDPEPALDLGQHAARPRPRSADRRRRRRAPPCRRSATRRQLRSCRSMTRSAAARDRLHPSGQARPIRGTGVDVGAWLRGLGLGQYEQAFRDNDIDARVLPDADRRRPEGARRRLGRPPRAAAARDRGLCGTDDRRPP